MANDAAHPGGRLLIIDSDGGVDDAVAILVALKECGGQVLALTSVFGNTTTKQASSNLCRIEALHQLAEGNTVTTNVPIYPGSEQPVCSSKTPDSWVGHGSNGLGGSPTEDSLLPFLSEPQDEHAVTALIRLVKEYSGKIELVALGPLTNLALACKLYPPFFRELRSLHILGGALLGRGNTSMVAEFNFWADPEAAKIVLEAAPAAGIPVVIIPWEATEVAGASWELFDRLTTSGTVRSTFLKAIAKTFEEMTRSTDTESTQTTDAVSSSSSAAVVPSNLFASCDTLPIIALLFPETIQDAVSAFVDVETVGAHGRGMMAIDWYGTHHNNRPQVKLIREMSRDALWNIVERVFCG